MKVAAPNGAKAECIDFAIPTLRRQVDARYGRLCVAFVIGLLLACQLSFCWAGLVHSLAGQADMRAFYTAGSIVHSGNGSSLYRFALQERVQRSIFPGAGQMLPFLYPAYSALLFVPLSLMPYKCAFVAFCLTNTGILALTVTLLRSYLPGLLRLPPLLFLAGCASLFPVSIALAQGQISFLLLLFYSVSHVLFERKRPFLAGLAVALALAKFQTALPVALLFLCWRAHRFVAGFVCGAVLDGAVSIAITGPAGVLQYVSAIGQVATGTLLHATVAKLQYGMSAADMPNLHGLLFWMTRGSLAGQAAVAVCSLSVIAWASSKRPSMPLALTAAMLVSYHLQSYDLILLLLPLTVVLSRGLEIDRIREALPRGPALVFSGCVAVLIPPVAPFLLVRHLSALFILPVFGLLWLLASVEHSEQSPFSPHKSIEMLFVEAPIELEVSEQVVLSTGAAWFHRAAERRNSPHFPSRRPSTSDYLRT